MPAITISKSDLLQALQKVRPTVANSQMVPILQTFCFKDGRVSSYNGMSGTTTKLDLGGADFALQADLFYRICSAMPGDITLDLSETSCTISSGSNKTKLCTLPTKGFPGIIPKDANNWYAGADFKSVLDKLAFNAGSNAMKPELMGIAFIDNYAYASDGKRISRQLMQESVAGPMMLPTAPVEHLRKLGQPDMMFCSGENQLGAHYKESKTIYVARVLASKFPVAAANTWLGELNSSNLYEFPDTFGEVVGRVKLLAAGDDRDVVIELRDRQLVVSTQSEGQAATELVPWDCPLSFRLAVDPYLLEEILGHTRKVDLTSVLVDKPTMLRFYDDGFDHALGLKHLRSE